MPSNPTDAPGTLMTIGECLTSGGHHFDKPRGRCIQCGHVLPKKSDAPGTRLEELRARVEQYARGVGNYPDLVKLAQDVLICAEHEREERERLEGDYQRIIREVLTCEPLPASSRPQDDQLEPPWEVIARVRQERDALRAALDEAVREKRAADAERNAITETSNALAAENARLKLAAVELVDGGNPHYKRERCRVCRHMGPESAYNGPALAVEHAADCPLSPDSPHRAWQAEVENRVVKECAALARGWCEPEQINSDTLIEVSEGILALTRPLPPRKDNPS